MYTRKTDGGGGGGGKREFREFFSHAVLSERLEQAIRILTCDASSLSFVEGGTSTKEALIWKSFYHTGLSDAVVFYSC